MERNYQIKRIFYYDKLKAILIDLYNYKYLLEKNDSHIYILHTLDIIKIN